MPKKKKIVRAAEKRAETDLLDNPPPHIAKKLGKPSELLKALASPRIYNWGGTKFDDYGNLISRPPDGKAANKRRTDEATSEALRLKGKYGQDLFNRALTSEIAKAEGVSERTIRRHRKRAQENGQAK